MFDHTRTARIVLAYREAPARVETDLDARTYVVDALAADGWLCDQVTVWPDRTATLNGRRLSRPRAAFYLWYARLCRDIARRMGIADSWEVSRYPRGIAGYIDDSYTAE